MTCKRSLVQVQYRPPLFLFCANRLFGPHSLPGSRIVKLTFPDGSVSTFEAGTTGMDVARSISRGLAKKALVCKLDGTPMDLTVPLPSGGEIRILTFADGEGADALRHSASHLLASAVKKLFPGTRLGIG
ncbi:MAG: TGS domain-containing protein, partial [Candidatus Aegiribacteria sp.]|nr:TGS domain-containing protein [Candidatus Aegiribacteria sp.]MBD3295628.1 TGS domain-containing protein [Candidatus Fermentibacteria bacterium]